MIKRTFIPTARLGDLAMVSAMGSDQSDGEKVNPMSGNPRHAGNNKGRAKKAEAARRKRKHAKKQR